MTAKKLLGSEIREPAQRALPLSRFFPPIELAPGLWSFTEVDTGQMYLAVKTPGWRPAGSHVDADGREWVHHRDGGQVEGLSAPLSRQQVAGEPDTPGPLLGRDAKT